MHGVFNELRRGVRCRRKYETCPHNRKHWHPRGRSGRYDIQGLRAVAVLAVIAEHMWHYPSGGFVGVDIFFVISGFLITGLLLRDHEKGRGARAIFVDFYRRRIKRIIPASTLVLAVTVVAASLTFNVTRAAETRGDAWWALFFGANFRMSATSTDYFDADGPVSPLQHYWSLSIEEQFYFVWPWLMLAIFAVFLSRHPSRLLARSVVFATITTATAASFAWALHQSSTNPAVAYFDSFSRVWELGLGAMLAVAAPLCHRIPDVMRPAMAYLGLGVMAVSLWAISPATTFPAPGALAPVLGTALVIAAGTFASPRQQRFLWPVTNRLMNYMGDLSYSLYLWHFPIIIIGAVVLGDTTSDKIVLTVVIAVVSYFAYWLVEDPLRQARRWTLDIKEIVRGAPDGYRFRAIGGLAALTVALTAAAVQPVEPPASPPILAAAKDSGGTEQPVGTRVQPLQVALTEQITEAVEATSWPDNLSPSMEDVLGGDQAPEDVFNCGTPSSFVDVEACTWGSSSSQARTAVIVGDSMSMTYVNPLRLALAEQATPWRITTLGTFACPFRDIPDSTAEAGCEGRKRDAVNKINQMKPDILFVVNSYYPTPFDEGQDPPQPAQWTERLSTALTQVTNAVGKVVLLAPPPAPVSPEECYTRAATPADCLGNVPDSWQAMAAAESALAEQLGGQWVDSSSWFCAFDYCPIFVGTTPVRTDLTHMSVAYGERIVPVVAEAFVGQKVLAVRRAS